MPHQCTSCGRTFPDGSKEMLSGCPDCGGNKFQFQPKGSSAGNDPSVTPENKSPAPTESDPSASTGKSPSADKSKSPSAGKSESPSADKSEASTSPATADQSSQPESAQAESSSAKSTQTGSSSARSARSPQSDTTPTDDSEQVADRAAEDTAQASARSDVVSPDELDQASQHTGAPSAADSSSSEAESDRHSDIDQLRDELNEQFESIRIVSPGTYELNLMELYDRQEYIISLQEDGRYVIEMPDAWGVSDE